jgi:riboflavin kinase/FMN adenylyltransferase
MEVFHGLKASPSLSKKTIITIGNFDGVHLGHGKILQFLVKESQKYDLFSLVLTFSPHPDIILGKSKVKMIQTLDQRLKAIEGFRVHGVLITSFNKEFSSLSSDQFIQKIAVSALKAEEVVIGENFRFGKNREGNINTFLALGAQLNFRVHEIPKVIKKGRTVSSSLIRALLQDGEIEEANILLGRPYEIEGRVIKGKDRGKALGFPTANIKTENEIIPLGVYVSQALIDSRIYPSLTNAGLRPTFGQEDMQIESYIIDFDKKLYGQKISIRFIKKIRDEIKFKSPEALSRQIQKDLGQAKAYFKLNK